MDAMQSEPSQGLQRPSERPEDQGESLGSQNIPTTSGDLTQNAKRVVKKSNQVCRFYGTKKGCRAGDQCPYRHIQRVTGPTASNATTQDDAPSSSQSNNTPAAVATETSSKLPLEQPKNPARTPVSKPVSTLQQKDPREFQISQVVRRFSPSREEGSTGTVLKLKLHPSDPDFPFELNALECSLTVPLTFPKDGKPVIRVDNKDIPRGFQINVERGFDSLCSGPSTRTLLQLLNDLDRNLERFLSSEKAQTIKIVPNRRREEPQSEAQQWPQPQQSAPVVPAPVSPSVKPFVEQLESPTWTPQQKKDARTKREAEIRQLEARMGRVPLFSSSKDGVAFNVPLQIPKPSRLPLSLQSLKEMTLVVPILYNLEPCRIKLKGVIGSQAENVEVAFEKRAKDHKDMTLMAHVNYLTQNIHTMAVSLTMAATPIVVAPPEVEAPKHIPEQAAEDREEKNEGVIDEDRPHLIFVSQPPPEWTRGANVDDESDSETTDEYGSEEESTDASEGADSQAGGASVPLSAPQTTLEKGVLLSFPHLELHGVELLELRDVSLSVKCDRCKQTLDIKNIKPAEPSTTSIRTESCNKCSSPISVSYRSEPMHVNSIKAGYIDLEGCTIVDLLPSRFLPTCAECSTTQPAPGIVSVRGESSITVCRECHHRLNFKLPEIKFLRVSSNDPRVNLPLRSKRKKENLGITAGTELPERGRCKHYSKSYRWFRFSCCNRVFPCDRCHDEKEEHPNEHANRMICGWCSREQNYRPEDCSSCGRSVIRKTGGGFWEGGKGTRDKTRMSRKDPRKFKRIGGGAKGGEK